MTPTLSVQAAKKLLEAAAALGVPVDAACAAARLDPRLCDDEHARLPLGVMHALWEAVAERYGRDDLVVRVVGHLSPRDYGVVGFLCMSSQTVGAAVELAAKYLRLYADEPRLEVTAGGQLRLHFTQPLPERAGLWLATEAALAELLSAARALSGRQLVPRAVSFTHRALGDRRPLDAFFGVPVRYGAETTALELTPEQLALALPRGDPRLQSLLEPVAQEALSRARRDESLLERARRELGGALSGGPPTVAVVASKLAMSERTLRRRLVEEGVGFRELLEQTRLDLARQYVADPAVPLAEVSFVLGFSEPSAFHRAFKRWTGRTPASFRREAGHCGVTTSRPELRQVSA